MKKPTVIAQGGFGLIFRTCGSLIGSPLLLSWALPSFIAWRDSIPSFIAPEQHQGFRAGSPLVSSAVPLGLLFFFYEPVQLWNDQRHQLGRRFVRPIDLARVDHTVRFQRVLP